VTARREEGTTLTELLVAIGVFSVLMVLVGSGMTAVFRGIADSRSLSNTEQDQRNAMLWISRAVRYIDDVDPPNAEPAVVAASSDSFTFTTYSGLGDVVDAPYQVTIDRDPSGDLVARMTGPSADGEGLDTSYVLMAASPRQQPEIQFQYLCTAAETPCNLEDDTSVWGPTLIKVNIVLSDGSSGIETEQTIVLVNRV